jgi:hypothetical protein
MAHLRQSHGEVGRHGRFADPTLARCHRDHRADARQGSAGFVALGRLAARCRSTGAALIATAAALGGGLFLRL